MPSAEIYPLSLHDALPILDNALAATDVQPHLVYGSAVDNQRAVAVRGTFLQNRDYLEFYYQGHYTVVEMEAGPYLDACYEIGQDRKSTRLNSSHMSISYAVRRDLPSFPTRRSSDLGQRARRDRRAAAPGVRLGGRQPASGRGAGHVPAEPRLPRVLLPGALHGGRDGGGAVPGRVLRDRPRSEEHTSELQSHVNLVCRPPRSTLFPYTTLFRSWTTRSPRQTCSRTWCTARRSTTSERSRCGARSCRTATTSSSITRGTTRWSRWRRGRTWTRATRSAKIGRAHV